ncbi:MAG TPA: cytochrome C [Geobacteraceae bacterium]
MKRTLAIVLLASLTGSGCSMFTAWKSIPPPGGCDQCHTVAISTNWKVAYQAPMLTDERNRNYFQTAEHTMTQPPKADSKLDLRKVEELQCFECHKAPSPAHRQRMGRFHH